MPSAACGLSERDRFGNLSIALDELFHIIHDMMILLRPSNGRADKQSTAIRLKDELSRWHQALRRYKAEVADQDGLEVVQFSPSE